MPSIADLAVGWTLLVGSVLLVVRSRRIAVLLAAAGFAWIGVGLAPFAGAAVGDLLPRLALVPTALVAVAAMALPPRATATRFDAAMAVVVIGVAVAAAGGWYRWSILIIGLATLVSAVPAPTSLRSGGAGRVAAWFGAGLMVVGALVALPGTATPLFVANLHDFVMIAGAAAITWSMWRGAVLARSGRIDLDGPSALGTALGDALGCGPLDIAFPGEDETWLDSSGRVRPTPSVGGALRSEAGMTIAWLEPAIPLDVVATQKMRRLLGPAAEAARLRAALRVRADEIDRSRQRLETAADDERSRLVALLQSGPLASLAQASELLVLTPSGLALVPRAAAADRVLGDVVRGLDPAAASGGLLPALEKLAAGAGARWSFASSVDLGPTESRAVWFTCAEGLANAAKHAPGASIEVRLERVGRTYVLSVCDDGCGGADAAGPGLCGLRERAAAVGATLYVDSPVGAGTSLRLVLPERVDKPRWHVHDAASTPIIGEPISGTVDA